MAELHTFQYVLIAIIFIWSGFVRSGLGFGGSVLTLPFLLFINNNPLVYLPIISVHLLFFATLTLGLDQRKKHQQKNLNNGVDWGYLKKALSIMIVPKLFYFSRRHKFSYLIIFSVTPILCDGPFP